MPPPDPHGYLLQDPRPIAASAPYTYFLPNSSELAAISAGDLVQLLFEHVPPGQEWDVERMWVKVGEAEADQLSGLLANKPDEPTATIAEGDLVRFERRRVIGISWADPDSAPRTPCRREYWDRCLVDDCVLDGTEPVEFIYREEPDMQEEGDTYPDSGWRIRGRMGGATDDEADARRPRYVAIGAVLNRDDSWLPYLDAPVGTSFMRDFEANTYVEEN